MKVILHVHTFDTLVTFKNCPYSSCFSFFFSFNSP